MLKVADRDVISFEIPCVAQGSSQLTKGAHDHQIYKDELWKAKIHPWMCCGDMYAGEWLKGQCHGCGVHTCEDGSKYSGEFKGGIKHGDGYYNFRNGDTYAGEYFTDKTHGFGVYRFENGHRYEGAWHEGRRQGCGMYTFRNGDTQSGYWDNGALTVSTSQNTLLSGPSTSVSHAKVLKAVQEARRIAEKAGAIADIDERVNRPVTVANRSANAARVAAIKAVQNRMHQHNDDDNVPLDDVV